MDEYNMIELKQKELEREIKEFVYANGVKFGSRAWGGYNTNSDLDMLMGIGNAGQLTNMIDEAGIARTDHSYYVSGFYFSIEGIIVNITIPKKEDWSAWQSAINMMYNAPEYVLANKTRRQTVFETLLAVLKKRV